MKYVELYGLEASNNGRSCAVHDCCGKSVVVLDMLILIPCLTEDGEEAVAACLHSKDGSVPCVVGYLPKYYLQDINRFINMELEVIELMATSDNTEERATNFKNKGVAICRVVY